MVVATVPQDANPYQRLLEAALANLGVEFRHPASLRLTELEGVDLVHLHWLEFLYAATDTPLSTMRRRLRAIRLANRLRSVEAGGVPLVWTMHNLRPHESRTPRLDDWIFTRAARQTATILAHSDHARSKILAAYSAAADRTVTIPHGNYDGIYPPASESPEALRKPLGIGRDERVLLSFGLLRRYKRVPELIQSFLALNLDGTRLVIAGRADEHTERALRAAAGRDPRVLVELGYASDQRVSDLHQLADAAILNYQDVFSSGVLLLSWSLGLPVIAPESTTADELAPPPATIPFGPSELGAAIEQLADTDEGTARAAALDAAAGHSWERIAQQVKVVYETALAVGQARP